MYKKFSDEDLKLLLAQGLSQAEIARKVGVSEQAVSWRVKRLKANQASQDQDIPAFPVNSNYQGNPSLKNQLNLKELKFLEFYLSGQFTIQKAMVAAGFGEDCHPGHLYWLAKKIINKYEESAPSARKVFRAVGVGEVKVAQKVLQLMDEGRSERTQLGATELAAKCLRLTEEPQQGFQGIEINITCSQRQAPEIPPGHVRPAGVTIDLEAQPTRPVKPLRITE